MMHKDENQFQDDADRRLWQQFRQTVSNPNTPMPSELDSNDLAAYLDGTADTALIETIEQQLIVDPRLLETIIELRAIRDAVNNENNSAVPKTVISTAKELVSQATTSSKNEKSTILYRINWSRLQWAAAAVFVLTAGWGGYRTGLNAYATDTMADTDVSALVFDLEGVFDESSVSLVDEAAGGVQ